MRDFLRFSVIMLAVLTLSFIVHYVWISRSGSNLEDAVFFTSYLGNYIVAEIIMLGMIFTPKSLEPSRGFLFMFGSVFKFIFFFLFLYPVFQQDGTMQQHEFFTFFVPYGVCLATETKLLINRLSRVN